jgi:hypothetical protein
MNLLSLSLEDHHSFLQPKQQHATEKISLGRIAYTGNRVRFYFCLGMARPE